MDHCSFLERITVMTTLEVGNKLVDLCPSGKSMEAVDSLYAPNIVSLEVHGDEKMPARMEGLKSVRGKSEWWYANHQVHSMEAWGPWPHGDRFIVAYKI